MTKWSSTSTPRTTVSSSRASRALVAPRTVVSVQNSCPFWQTSQRRHGPHGPSLLMTPSPSGLTALRRRTPPSSTVELAWSCASNLSDSPFPILTNDQSSVNCGPDGAPNSFTNFKNAALEIGKQLAAASPSPSDGGYGAPAATPSGTWTAAYGGYTVAPVSDAVLVTQTVTLESSTWTTTYSSAPGSPAPTPATLEGTVHKVVVGGPSGLVFSPPS